MLCQLTVRKMASANTSGAVPLAAANCVESLLSATFSRLSFREIHLVKQHLVQRLFPLRRYLSAGFSGAVSGAEVGPGCTTVYFGLNVLGRREDISMVTTHANFVIPFLKLVPSLCMSVIMSDVVYEMRHTPWRYTKCARSLTVSQPPPSTSTAVDYSRLKPKKRFWVHCPFNTVGLKNHLHHLNHNNATKTPTFFKIAP